MEAVFEPTGVSPQEQTLLVQKTPVAWHITTSLYHLVNPKVVYDAVVKLRFPAAFLNPSMLTGNPLDLQIAARKAIDRVTRNAMITKSLPMEFLVAISPRSQITESLQTFGFRPTDRSVLVVWLHSTPLPPQADSERFRALLQQGGQEVPLESLTKLRNLAKIAGYYKFEMMRPDGETQTEKWRKLLNDFVTSQIATKQ